MDLLQEKAIGCPYCGETITVIVDCSISEQTYTEDCQVCCRPIVFDVSSGRDQATQVSVRQEND